MSIGSWLKSWHKAWSGEGHSPRAQTRGKRRRKRVRSSASELLEERICLSAASLDQVLGDAADVSPPADLSTAEIAAAERAAAADSLWYLPPDYAGALPEADHDADAENWFVSSGWKWSQPGGLGTPVTITYSYSNLLDGGLRGGLTADQLRAAVEEALGLWAQVAPLNFVEMVDNGPAVSDGSYFGSGYPQIRIGHEYIDGSTGANVLAHAWFPTGGGLAGDVHLDNANTWKLGPNGGIDVIEVLAHELGHALGLDHQPTSGASAIMNPYYGGRFTTGLGSSYLLEDDIAGIRAIYGFGTGSVIPLDSPGEGAPADDHGNSAATATALTLGAPISGVIEVGGDQDWFSFQATAGATYILQTALGTLPDSTLRLYASNGTTLLRTNDNGAGIGPASRIEWTASTSGTYYVSVQAALGTQVGTYALSTSVRNVAPVLANIGDRTMSHNQDRLSINLSATDANGDPLSYSARIVTNAAPLADVAYQLDQQLGLYVTPDFLAKNYYYNARGAGEKYLMGSNGSWYLLFANGELYRWQTSLKDLQLITILTSAYYSDPSLLWDAKPPQTSNISVAVSGSTLTIDPPDGFLGRFNVEVTVSDGRLSDSKVFAVDVTNSPVTLAPIADQTMSRTADKLSIPLSASDADGDPLSYSIEISGSNVAYQLDQTYNFSYTPDFLANDFYRNARGVGEKYLMGNNGAWFLLYADGRLYRWGTSLADSTLIATLDPGYYANPALLCDVPAASVDQISATVNGNTLTIDPPADYAGSFQVTVRVTDGVHTATRSFNVTVANSAPQLGAIGEQTMSRNQDTLQVNLGATDADGDPLTYTVEISGSNQAYQLDQTYNFSYTPDFLANDFYRNARGVGEKYLMGNNGAWFLLYSDGRLYRWGTSIADLTLIATLDPGYYANPALLCDVSPSSGDEILATISGGTLTLDPPAGYAGTFQVTVTVSDGAASDTETFLVRVANAPPVLATIGNRSMSTTIDVLQIALSATDADGDAVTYSVTLDEGNPLYQLDQQRGFYVTPDFLTKNYYLNARGAGEKYLMGSNGAWYLIYSGGRVYQWGTTLANSPLIATLGDAVYADPSLLWDAQPRGADLASAWVSGNVLSIDPIAGFTGSLNVTVTASDGTQTDGETFTLTVSAASTDPSPALLASTSVLYVNFDGAGLGREELVRWAGTDWREALDSRFDPEGDGLTVQPLWSDWSGREGFIGSVVAYLEQQLAPFGVQVVRHAGGAVEGAGATTVFVGETDLDGAYADWIGLASDIDRGNDNATDLALALPFLVNDNLEESARALANLILHEAGHTWGLDHVDSGTAADLMGLSHEELGAAALARSDAGFLDQSFAEHNAGGALQNSYQELSSVFATQPTVSAEGTAKRQAAFGELVGTSGGTKFRVLG